MVITKGFFASSIAQHLNPFTNISQLSEIFERI
jgi:hypothetical protein